MKFELIKTTDSDGIWYFVEKDKKYVPNSFTRDLDEAKKNFDEAIKNAAVPPVKEVLISTEI